MDRFLSAVPVPRPRIQLVGIAAMWVSAKYEEIYAPTRFVQCSMWVV